MTTQELKNKISDLLTEYAQGNKCSINLEAHVKRTYSDVVGEVEYYDLDKLNLELNVI